MEMKSRQNVKLKRGRKSYRIGLKELQFIMEVLKVGKKR